VPARRSAPAANALIAALPRRDREDFVAGCESVGLAFGEVLCTPGERVRRVYFPTHGFIALLTPGNECASLEVGLVGAEGMLGITLILGVDAAPLSAFVQGAGGALRMDADRFRRELRRSQPLQRALNRYLYVCMAQIAQSAACTYFHLLDERLARWLLMAHDRSGADEFRLTHELLARMLGVRRVGVTKAAGRLQRAGLIRYSRGHITVLSRAGLEAASCGCYRGGCAVYERLLKPAQV
jgi:CRP-like cAMP-binding protein